MSTTDPAVAKRFKASSFSGSHTAQVGAAISAAASYAAAGDVNGDLFDDTGRQYALQNTLAAATNQKAGPNALQCIAEDDVGGAFAVSGSRCLVMQDNVRLEFSKDVSITAGTSTCANFVQVDGVENFTVCAKAGAFSTQRNPGGANVFHPEWSVGKVVCDLRGHVPGSGGANPPAKENIRFSSMDGSGAGGGAAHFKYQNLFIVANNDCTSGWKQDQSLFTPRGGTQASACQYGIFIDMDFDGQYSGYGAWQNSACWRTLWANIRAHGGTPMRNEADGKFGGSDLDWGVAQCDFIACYGEDCNKVLTVQPNKAANFFSWYVDGIYGIGCLEVGNAGQYRTAGTPAGADQTMHDSFFGEIWCLTGDHSAWQEESPCQSNDSVATWARTGTYPNMDGDAWQSMKYNLGHRGGPGHGQDGGGAEIVFASRGDGTHYNGTRDGTITDVSMRARWATKKINLGGGGITVPGKPVLTGPTSPQDEPFRLTVHATVDKTSSWEWRLTTDGVAGSWLAGNPTGTRDVQVYGTQLGVRTLDQEMYPSTGTLDTVKWIDHLEDDIIGRLLDFRNCYLNINTTSVATNYFHDTYHGQTGPNPKGTGMEWGAWWRGEVAYIQIHGRKRSPSLPAGVFTSALPGDDCFWDNTAPNIPPTDPQWPSGPRGIAQGHFDALITSIGNRLKGMVYPNNSFCQDKGIVGQPVQFLFCMHHEPVDDFAVQGYPNRQTAGPGWAAAVNHWKTLWDAIPGGIPGLLGYVANLTNGTYDGSNTASPADYTGHLNFRALPSGDAYVKEGKEYESYHKLTDGQFQYARTYGEALHQGELGYAAADAIPGDEGSPVSMTDWLTALGTEVDTRRNVGWICFQANKQPTQPYFEEIHEDDPIGTQAAFADLVASATFMGLPNGVYKLEARCTNSAGLGAVSNPYQITINNVGGTLPAKAVITSGPDPQTSLSSATFSFSSTDSTSLQTSLDGAAFATNTSPHTFTGLGVGFHTLVVHGVNTDGTGPPSDTFTWEVVASQSLAALVLSGTVITDGVGKWGVADSTSLVLTLPPASIGNLLLMFVAWDSGTPIGVPAGWTLVNQTAAATTIEGMLCSRVYLGTEAPTVTVTGPTATGCGGVILNLSGIYSSTPILTSTTATSG